MIRRVLTLIVVVIAVVFAAVFATLNTEIIQVDLLFARYELAQSFVIIGALITGVLLGLAIASLFLLRVTSERRKLRRALSTAETEITSLRSLPLQNAD
ncbi:MAG: LapA family protein [Pseudomonadota bacterium]